MSTLRKAIVLFVPLAIAVTACEPEPNPPPPLEGAAIGGPFELVNPQGETVRWSDFAGQWRMVYFGYAYCPDVCPFDVARMMNGYRQFAAEHPERAAQVQPIFITIDPARDTPEVVGEFAANFGDKLLGLTGTVEQVDAAAKNFGVYVNRNEPNAQGGYLVDHSNASFLMAPDGEPVALLPVEQSAEGVAAELDTWVR